MPVVEDIEVDPNNPSIWYVAVGSGGVWKTSNGGITWQPIFDDEAVFSTGDVTIDTGTTVPGPPIGVNTTGQEAEGPNCASDGGH